MNLMNRRTPLHPCLFLVGLFVLGASTSSGEVETIKSTALTELLPGPAAEIVKHRARRDINDGGVEAVAAHNMYRSLDAGTLGISNMRKMIWNSVLADMAQVWADTCNFAHGQPTGFNPPYNPLGQNLAATSGTEDVAFLVKLWYDEKVDYTYATKTCAPTKVCGHYTQVVWAESVEVGCGHAFCPTLSTLTNAQYLVCNYGPAGNFNNQFPFELGAPCSACPADLPDCENNLCTDVPPTTEQPTPDAATTHGPIPEEPITEGPMTEGPATEGPATEGPATEGPATEGPATEGPATEGPVTAGPVTAGPVTAGPVTAGPVTAGPVTAGPVTAGPVTERPTEGPVTEGPAPQTTTTTHHGVCRCALP